MRYALRKTFEGSLLDSKIFSSRFDVNLFIFIILEALGLEAHGQVFDLRIPQA